MSAGVLKTDIFIVGGGPAGLAAGIALRAHGMRVTVADSERPPIDKACGEGLMPPAVTALKKLGVALGALQAVPFRGIRFIGGGKAAEGSFQGVYGLGVRRTALHKALVERAAEAGVGLLWGARVQSLARGAVSVDSRRVQCRWIIGADGQNSQVRKWAGLEAGSALETRFGFRRHYPVEPWTDFVEAHWGRTCQLVVTPVGARGICLTATSRSAQWRLAEALGEFPEISRRLAKLAVLDKERGAVSALRILHEVLRDPFVLLGDASGSVDSLTGEGMGLAFQHADALGEAISEGDLSLYAAAHRRINRPHEQASRLLIALEKRAWLRWRAFSALARDSQIFDRLLAAHSGCASPPRFGAREIFQLGLRMLAMPG